eukprot:gene22556-biopygen5761
MRICPKGPPCPRALVTGEARNTIARQRARRAAWSRPWGPFRADGYDVQLLYEWAFAVYCTNGHLPCPLGSYGDSVIGGGILCPCVRTAGSKRPHGDGIYWEFRKFRRWRLVGAQDPTRPNELPKWWVETRWKAAPVSPTAPTETATSTPPSPSPCCVEAPAPAGGPQ